MTGMLLQIRNLSIGLPFGGDRKLAVEDVSIGVGDNELLCVVGESGSGKSVLSHSIMGLLPNVLTRRSGDILFGEEDVTAMSERELRRLRGAEIGMVFQEPMSTLNPLMRIGDQIDESIRFHRQLAKSKRRVMVLEVLESVGFPEPERMLRRYPKELSGGQRQRVMIAMALVLRPRLLIADEPTTALDVTTQAQILDLIRKVQREMQMAVMFVTHDFGVVAEIADRVAVMRHGILVEQGTAAEVLNRPKHGYTRQLLDSVPKGTPVAPAAVGKGEPVLEARDIKKVYRGSGSWRKMGDVVASDDVSFTLHRGETISIVGESGSGKSTLGRILMHLLQPDSGSVTLGKDTLSALKGSDLRRARRRIQMVFQDPFSSLNPRCRIGTQMMRNLKASGIPGLEAKRTTDKWLERVGLDASAANRFPQEFSGGQRQRIAIARALCLDPEVVVADEPVSALDVTIQRRILDLLEDLKKEMNLSLIFITHDLAIAAEISDTIIVMKSGRIVETGASRHVFENPHSAYTKTLIESSLHAGFGHTEQSYLS
ncbi:ABC transporter ATP-binding protein [Oceaniradius stylonematis]|uniref:ABC transporter ATP-binding protein n=1 Tax=Oceaniradius stylonematis TaxID=2184161 RepID=UPI00273F55CC|nr:ABC transporter ATP-binding protein [Oceaniradius stylonematis]